jgi:hypothetical protein
MAANMTAFRVDGIVLAIGNAISARAPARGDSAAAAAPPLVRASDIIAA